MIRNIRVLLPLLFLIVNTTLVEDMDDEIGEAVFHDGELYLIYVYKQINEQYFVPFRSYCQTSDVKCTTMNPKVEQYYQFVSFVGVPQSQFFLIIDAQGRKKYVMDQTKQISIQTLTDFVQGYKAGTIQAYISSEEIPKQDNQFVTHLVGKTVYQFIQSDPESYKIILFTTDRADVCQNCQQILIDFKQLSQKMKGTHRQFGYIDLVKNQHPEVKQQMVPLIAVYKQGAEIHVFKKFFVADLETKIYALERGEVLPEQQQYDDDEYEAHHHHDHDHDHDHEHHHHQSEQL